MKIHFAQIKSNERVPERQSYSQGLYLQIGFFVMMKMLLIHTDQYVATGHIGSWALEDVANINF